MPLNLPRVRPGDLITAAQWNAVLDVLDQQQAALDALGTGPQPGGPPVIASVQPTSQPAVGSELTLVGSGFGLAIENTVLIAGRDAPILGGGGDQLRVQVPNVPNLPQQGLSTQVSASNPRGFASHPIRVLPAVLTVPEGQLFANLTASPAGTIDAGTTADFVFTLRAEVGIAETYSLSPLVTAETAAGEWRAEVLDSSDNPITAITLPAALPPEGVSRQVRVRVTVPPGTDGTSADLSLTVRSQRNTGLATTSPTFTIDVGEAAPEPEQLTISAPAAVLNGTLDPDGTVAASPPQTRVTYTVAGTEDGVSYTMELGTIPPGWNASVFQGASRTATGPTLNFRIDFAPSVSATPASFDLRVRRTDDESVFGTRVQAVRRQT